MVYHTVVLEPTLKATPISQSGDGKVKPLTKKQKRNCRLLKIPKLQQKYYNMCTLHSYDTCTDIPYMYRCMIFGQNI